MMIHIPLFFSSTTTALVSIPPCCKHEQQHCQYDIFVDAKSQKNNDLSAMDIAHIWNAGALMFLLCTTLFFCNQMMFGNKIPLVVRHLIAFKRQYLTVKVPLHAQQLGCKLLTASHNFFLPTCSRVADHVDGTILDLCCLAKWCYQTLWFWLWQSHINSMTWHSTKVLTLGMAMILHIASSHQKSDCDNHWCNKEHILLMMTLLSFLLVSVTILAFTHKPQSKPIQR